MADRVGQQLGNYQLIQLLGEGGFAEVYLGEHIHLSTRAAIKVMHTQLASDDLERFRTEARTIAHLVHPNIVRVLEFGVESKTPFLVMDYAPNGTLRQRHPKGTLLPLATIVSYVKQVAEALQYAHDEKLIHRDIKPENMLLGRRNEVLLSDFGIAIVAQSSRYQSTQDMAGTIAYMAPEQIQAHPRPASDQYSLGVVVYEWLSGDRPFHGSFSEIAIKHTIVPPPPLREKGPMVSPDVEHIVMTALAKEPKERFASVQAFANALEQASLSVPPVRSVRTIVAPPRRETSPIPQKSKEQWLEEGNTHHNAGRYKEALEAYEHVTQLDSNDALAHYRRSYALNELKRYEEALVALDRAIQLNSNDAVAYNNKGYALNELKRYEEALLALDRAIQLDPNDAVAYTNKGWALIELKRYKEALVACDRVIQLDPNDADAYTNKGNALYGLKQYDEALLAYDRAIQLDPNDAVTYTNKGVALDRLGRTAEAKQAYRKARELGYSG